MDLDPGGIYGLQSLLLTALSKITISLQFDLAKLEGKLFFHGPISQNKKKASIIDLKPKNSNDPIND